MKSKAILKLFVLPLFYVTISNGQTPNTPMTNGEYFFKNEVECVTNTQRKDIKETLKANVDVLQKHNKLAFSKKDALVHPLFIWPVKKANHITYNDVWSVSNYVDHNSNYPNQLTDYNCGTSTYDTDSGYNHQGVDIYTWPYTWKLLDDDGAEIIAAADGQIIGKNDGQFDRSCSFNSNQWNAVYVQHNDGSIAWYGHMKNGSLTTKTVGEIVVQGEVLGIVGSSGNSTGPHLHFEVYTDNTYTQLVDPFSGSCNNMNSESWWENQKPYIDPNINALMTHSKDPNIFPGCPTTETTYESAEFEAGATIYLSTYLRDQEIGKSLHLRILRPDNSAMYDWIYQTTGAGSSWYYYWSIVPDTIGEWTWEVSYEGQTLSYNFNVNEPLSVNKEKINVMKVYPNPSNNNINISSLTKVVKIDVISITGASVISLENNQVGINNFSIESLQKGIYFLVLEDVDKERKTIKLIKD
ncbi:M23 family metallopeptidase [Flavobacteriaceae bacterium SZ-1-7]|uniref:peptidoglycan DD-metalloendopeptidase family protein n=1 Tax=Tamlana sedimenti TaxID=3134126 RepID=UPI0031250887